MASIPEEKRIAIKYLSSFAVAIVISMVIAVTIDYICFLFIGETSIGTWYDKYWIGFFFCCAFLASCFVVLRGQLASKPEHLYLIIILTVSLFMAWSLSVLMVGWDTGIHFRNVIGWADLDDKFELSLSELAYSTSTITQSSGVNDAFSLNGLNLLEDWLDANNKDIAEVGVAYSFWKVATAVEYLPCAAVMFFCELVDAPFTVSHFLSLVPSVLIYAFVTYAGMKKLKCGKALYAVICLLPTSVFLVSNYGYQYWNMAFFMYGFACLASFLQYREEVPLKSIAFMLTAFFLASLPRLAYAPLILLSLLVPKKCFRSTTTSRIYRIGIIVVTVFAASIYLIPLMQNGLGEGDSRGGQSIDPAAQMAYIFSDPLGYIKRMICFYAPPYATTEDGITVVSGFLTPSASIRVIGSYAYLGRIEYPLFLVLLALLFFLALSDTKKGISYGPVPALSCIGLSLAVIVAITTAMYLDFNNVGEDAFRGVQARYLLPFVYPTLAFLGNSKWNLNGSRISSSMYNGMALAIAAGVLLTSWWQNYVCSIY